MHYCLPHCLEDGGQTWKRDRTTDDLAANLYDIKFVGPSGFILGNDGGESGGIWEERC